jgi:hypothetical protein
MPRAIVKTAATVSAILPMLLFSANVAQGQIVLEPLPSTQQGGGMSTPAQPVVPQLPLFVEPAKGGMTCPVPKVEEEPETPEEPFVDHCRTLETRLPYIPDIMDHLGWTNGEALMRKWFSDPANDDPEKGIPDISTIKIDWVLGYDRAREVYDKAINDKVWMNGPAQNKIIDKLIIKQGIQLPTMLGIKVAFGNAGAGITSAALMQQFNDDYQFQYREVNSNSILDPLDDLFAALGNFNFNFVTQGTVEYLGKNANGKDAYKVTLTQVGIYVRDSYDFNDASADWHNPKTWVSQPLGYWDCAERNASRTPGPGAYYVNNEDFRKWRDNYGNGKGGDFLVFSDIKVINVNDTFTFAF